MYLLFTYILDTMSNINFLVDDNTETIGISNNNIINYDEINMDIDSQLASVLTEEEYNKYINDNFNDDCIDIEQLMLFYNEYNVKSVTQLLQYYGIYKPKMLKNEMIQLLVLFETQEENASIVKKRIRLWRNIEELKSDSFFSKYIMF